MTAETEVLGHDVGEREQTNEERILAFVAERPDGCSSFAIAIETRIQRGAVEFILEKLEHQGKVQGTRNKKGVITWYPGRKTELKPVPVSPAPPELPKPAPIVEDDDEAAAWARMATDEEEEADDTEDDPKRVKCLVDGCKTIVKRDRKSLYNHYYSSHHKLSSRERAELIEQHMGGKEKAEASPAEPEKDALYCRMPGCGAGPFDDGRKRHGHESFCEQNPNRVRNRAGKKAEASENSASLLDSVVNDRPSPEPLPIDDTAPQGSELKENDSERLDRETASLLARKMEDTDEPSYPDKVRQDLAVMPECEGDSCAIAPDPVVNAPFAEKPSGPPAPSGYVGRMINELPPAVVKLREDPLAELVRRHRVRIGREISKLKRVERKLRRRAAAAESMADRVKAARRTKEKELDRFEREVAAVQGGSS